MLLDVARRNLASHFNEARVNAVSQLLLSRAGSVYMPGPFVAWPRKLQLLLLATLLHADVFPATLLECLPALSHLVVDDPVVSQRILSIAVHAGLRVSLEARVSVLLSAAFARQVTCYPRPHILDRFQLNDGGMAQVRPQFIESACEALSCLSTDDTVAGRRGPLSALCYVLDVAGVLLSSFQLSQDMLAEPSDSQPAWLAECSPLARAGINVDIARACIRLACACLPSVRSPLPDNAATPWQTCIIRVCPWLMSSVLGSQAAWRMADVRLLETLVAAAGPGLVAGLAYLAFGGDTLDAHDTLVGCDALPLGLSGAGAAAARSAVRVPAGRALLVALRRDAVGASIMESTDVRKSLSSMCGRKDAVVDSVLAAVLQQVNVALAEQGV